MNPEIKISETLKMFSEYCLFLLRLLEERGELPTTAKANLREVEKNLSACLDILRKLL